MVLVRGGHSGQGPGHTPSSCRVPWREEEEEEEERGRTRCGNLRVLSANRFVCASQCTHRLS